MTGGHLILKTSVNQDNAGLVTYRIYPNNPIVAYEYSDTDSDD